MVSQADKSKPILIIGGGCFGLATAHTLASDGYSNITVLEKDDQMPSRFSAAHDLNKVVRAEYIDPFYTQLSTEAIRLWQSHPLYSPYYFETGFLNVVSAAAGQGPRKTVANYLASLQTNRAFDGKVFDIKDGEQIRELVPAFSGPVSGWAGYYNRMAGYAHSANASRAVYEDCVRLGVQFECGAQDGQVETLLFDGDGSNAAKPTRVCTGARTKGKKLYRADRTIVALGAGVGGLLPQIGKQVTGCCWGVVHIQLTPQEAEQLRGIPVTNVRDLAFFFEPDRATHKLKFCHMGGGFSNFRGSKEGQSLPFAELADSQFVPADDEDYIRRLLREVLPQFADRPLIDAHLCWFADTPDSDYIIDYVPGTNSSLVVLSGDSGHGFKMLPIFGRFTKELLEKGTQAIKQWRWKNGDAAALADQPSWRSGGGPEELQGLARAML